MTDNDEILDVPFDAAEQVDYILLQCNPNPDPTKGWSRRTGRTYDIFSSDYEPDGDWSVAVNRRRIGPGTVGLIVRNNGDRLPPVVGCIVVTSTVYGVHEKEVVYYADGPTWRWPTEYEVDGADLAAAGWPNVAPWGATTPTRFANGQKLTPDQVKIFESVAHPVVLDWIDLKVAHVIS